MLKFTKTVFGLAFTLLLSGGMAVAAPDAGGVAPASPLSGAAQLVPHRAIYKLSLASVHNGSKVADVTGKMFFEWKDACDGWTIEQRFQLHFVYTQADEVETVTNSATWESKDGLNYRFNVHKLVNGAAQDDVHGDASLSKLGGTGVVHYQGAKAKDDKLAAGTIFPTTHTIELLNHAAAGDIFFDRNVFDGTDDDGTTEINSYIGSKTEPETLISDKGGVLKEPGWNIRMAFFPLTSQTAMPDYEMNAVMLRNGVTQSMLIDYGDFTMAAALESIEKIPDTGC